jgi:hypothetical protein
MSAMAILRQLWRRATILLIMKIVYRVSEQDFVDAYDLFAANEPWYRRYSRRSLAWFGACVLATEAYYLIEAANAWVLIIQKPRIQGKAASSAKLVSRNTARTAFSGVDCAF